MHSDNHFFQVHSGFAGLSFHTDAPHLLPVDGAAFREALGCFASGVTVVTAGTRDGEIAGLTANAFTSVSLDPPLVLVCIANGTRSIEVLRRAGRFAVHVLRADQMNEARAFARSGPDKLKDIALVRSARGIPVLPRCLTRLECALAAEHGGGDHGIFLGRVMDLEIGRPPHEPLTFFLGRLGALGLAGPDPEHGS